MWTQEREAIATKMWRDGYSGSQIAAELGGDFTRSAVIGKIHRLGVAVDLNSIESRRKLAAHERPKRKPRGAGRPSRADNIVKLREIMRRPGTAELALPVNFSEHATIHTDLHEFERQEGRKLCRFPISEPTATMLVCGAVAMVEGSYCCRHARIAYTYMPGDVEEDEE